MRDAVRLKSPGRWLDIPAGAEVVVAVRLEQLQFLGPVDRCPTVVDSELVVDVFGVGAQGVQRHHELAGNVWATQVGSEQSQHVKLTLAERLDQVGGSRLEACGLRGISKPQGLSL